MKGFQVLAVIGGVTLAAMGVALAATNPSQGDYEKFAVEQLTAYLKSNVCPQVPKVFGQDFAQRQCLTLVDTGRPQIQQIISQNTQRQNFIIFSIYKTDLSVGSFIPAYHFQTLALFQNFQIYQIEKK